MSFCFLLALKLWPLSAIPQLRISYILPSNFDSNASNLVFTFLLSLDTFDAMRFSCSMSVEKMLDLDINAIIVSKKNSSIYTLIECSNRSP